MAVRRGGNENGAAMRLAPVATNGTARTTSLSWRVPGAWAPAWRF